MRRRKRFTLGAGGAAENEMRPLFPGSFPGRLGARLAVECWSVIPLQEDVLRPLRYSINVTLDGCVDHRAASTDEELHRFWAEKLAGADALLFGRVTYEM